MCTYVPTDTYLSSLELWGLPNFKVRMLKPTLLPALDTYITKTAIVTNLFAIVRKKLAKHDIFLQYTTLQQVIERVNKPGIYGVT